MILHFGERFSMRPPGLADDEAVQKSGRLDRNTLAEAHAQRDLLQFVNRVNTNPGHLPGVPVDFVLRHRFEHCGVDRTKPKGTDGNAVDDTVATRAWHLLGRCDLFDRFDQGMERSIILEIAKKVVKPSAANLNVDRVNEVDRGHLTEDSAEPSATASLVVEHTVLEVDLGNLLLFGPVVLSVLPFGLVASLRQ